MHLPPNRPTFQQAVEGLKVHQLRKENVLIFNELKESRSDVSSRQQELDTATNDIVNLKTHLKDAKTAIEGTTTKFVHLQAELEQTRTDIAVLRQEHQSILDHHGKKIDSLQVACQEQGAEVQTFNQRVTTRFDAMNRDVGVHDVAIQELRGLLAVCADRESIEDLRIQVEELAQHVSVNKQNQDSVSKVTDTFERSTRQASVSTFISHKSHLGEMLQTFQAASGLPVPETPNDNIAVRSPEKRKAFNLVASSLERCDLRNQPKPQPVTPRITSLNQKISNIQHPMSEQPHQCQDGNMQFQTDSEHPQVPQLEHEHHKQNRNVSQKDLDATQTLAMSVNEASTTTTIETMRILLDLRQGTTEGLVPYFNRLLSIVERLPSEEEIERICLRRFIHGLRDDEANNLFAEWLHSSEITIQSARDFVVLWSRSTTSGQAVTPNSATVPSWQHAVSIETPDYRQVPREVREETIESLLEDEQEAFAELHQRDREGETASPKRKERPRACKRKFPKHNSPADASFVTTRAAWRAQIDPEREETDDGDLEPDQHKRRKEAWERPRNDKGRFDKQPGKQKPIPRSQTARKIVNRRNKNQATSPEQPTIIKDEETLLKQGDGANKRHVPPSQGESPVTPQRPGQPRARPADFGQLIRDHFPSSGPMNKPNPTGSRPEGREPGLGFFEAPNPKVIPQTSDALSLPPVLQEDKRGPLNSIVVKGKRLKTKRDSPPEIPILTLSTSDFEG